MQRCGDEIAGGAESLCLQTARHMSVEWDVEILTTCARDARTWEDAYPAGATTIGGVAARRFSVPVPRDGAAFDRASRIVARGGAGAEEESAWLRAQGPHSPDLLAYLEREGARFDRIFFYSYLYATTVFGLPLVSERSVLVPLAHDEWMLQVPAYERVFASAAAIAYSSEEERALVLRTFPGVRDTPECICGVGIEPPPPVTIRSAAFREAYAPEGDLFVCVGRVEEAKGTAELLAYFEALQVADQSARTLLLLGPVAMAIPKRTDVVALGQRSDAEKWDALAAATIVCVPSAYESLSLVSLEAWAVGTPILANGASAVLIGQCRRANGGLWYANESEFVELARTRLFGRADDLGASGRRYVRERYTWDHVREALRGLLVDGANAVTNVASIADVDSDASPPSP